jgi:hypothetical protein
LLLLPSHDSSDRFFKALPNILRSQHLLMCTIGIFTLADLLDLLPNLCASPSPDSGPAMIQLFFHTQSLCCLAHPRRALTRTFLVIQSCADKYYSFGVSTLLFSPYYFVRSASGAPSSLPKPICLRSNSLKFDGQLATAGLAFASIPPSLH